MAITDDFTGLPIGLLICQPIIEVAKGQAERAAAIMHEHITFALEHLHSQLELYPQDFLRMPTADKPAKTRSSKNRRNSA